MKTDIRSVMAGAILGMALFGAVTAEAQTSGYTQYANCFTLPVVQPGTCSGFSLVNGVYTMWTCDGTRVEMRWCNWPVQTAYNQWQGDVLFTSASQKTCIMQIKSNTGGEPIFIQVYTPGTLRNDNGSVFVSGISDKWFRLSALYNPVNGDARAYINGSQKVVRSVVSSSRDWHFMNGVNGGSGKASFRNMSTWKK